jgi:catalase
MEALKAAGVHSEIVSKNLGMITAVDGRQLEVNKNYVSAGSILYDAVYVTGGRQCADTLLAQGDSLHFVNEAFKHAKAVGATNEGVDLIAASQIQGVPTAGPDTQAQLISELGVVTIRNAAEMADFSREFVGAIAQHRHWARQKQKELVPA